MPETTSTTFKLPIPGEVPVTVKLDAPRPCQAGIPVLILAHGSSNNLDFPLLAIIASHLAQTGQGAVVRFNFPYVERGTNSPDPRHVLEATMLTVCEHAEHEFAQPGSTIFVGGKSLGAHTAAELVSRGKESTGVSAAGLILLGYPLHSPGQKDRLYLEPLRHIDVPSLFFVGTRDPFCDPDLLGPVVAGLELPGQIQVIEGGDHSLCLPPSAGVKPEETYATVARQVAAFIAGCSCQANGGGPDDRPR